MATPTRRHAASVSTPSLMNQSSPAPRSVPSPVASRQTAGKTPINHPTGGSTGSKTFGSTPMVQNLSQSGSGTTSSPSANLLGFNTPSGGLGIEGATPAALQMHTPGVGGTSMVPTMSEMGLNANGTKRDDDEVRRAKMRKVLKTVGKSKGRVSEEGIARISRRVGFQNDIDAEKLTADEKERKVGNRPISTAGNLVLVEIDLKNNVPHDLRVQIQFERNMDSLEQGDLAAKVLLKDLEAPDGIALHATLDRFALNLERLARIDRLSASGVNCFAALHGVYLSLRRLYEQEQQIAKTLSNDCGTDDELEMQVTCKKSGRPTMHVGSQLGLGLVYWREGSKIASRSREQGNEMEVDGQDSAETGTGPNGNDEALLKLSIGAEACPATLYPSIRVSNEWLPEPLELPSPDFGEGIPWHDPTPTFLNANADADAMTIDGDQKLPDIRFTAKLDPPVVVPYQTAMNILSSVNVQPPQMLSVPPHYATLLFNPEASAEVQVPATGFSRTAEQSVLSVKDGVETTVEHIYTLSSVRPTYAEPGSVIQDLPFSHPRQLVALLPTLRQWARVGSLLKALFPRDTESNAAPPQADGSSTNESKLVNGSNMHNLTLDDILGDNSTSHTAGKIPIDISLTASPIPTLEITLPTSTSQTARVTLQVLENAEIVVANQDGVQLDATISAEEQGRRIARALDACGDLGVWIEWLRTRTIAVT